MFSASIIVPVLNRKDLVSKCLNSLLKLNYPRYEILVIDGGSTDGTAELLKQYSKKYKKLRIFSELRPGPGIARNMGIKNSKGEIIIFVDSDCIVEKNWLREIVKQFNNPKTGGVIGRTKADHKGLFWAHMENTERSFIGHNTAYRKKLLQKAGGYDKRFAAAFREDTDMAFNIMEQDFEITYSDTARMRHISKRCSAFQRLRNQRKFMYDALLYKKHRKLYKKYGFLKELYTSLLPIIPVALIAVFLFLDIRVSLLIIGLYVAYILNKLRKEDGSLREDMTFLLLIWLLPIARLLAVIKGFYVFRNIR